MCLVWPSAGGGAALPARGRGVVQAVLPGVEAVVAVLAVVEVLL